MVLAHFFHLQSTLKNILICALYLSEIEKQGFLHLGKETEFQGLDQRIQKVSMLKIYAINNIITLLSRVMVLQLGCRNLMGRELKIMTQLDDPSSFSLILQST